MWLVTYRALPADFQVLRRKSHLNYGVNSDKYRDYYDIMHISLLGNCICVCYMARDIYRLFVYMSSMCPQSHHLVLTSAAYTLTIYTPVDGVDFVLVAWQVHRQLSGLDIPDF